MSPLPCTFTPVQTVTQVRRVAGLGLSPGLRRGCGARPGQARPEQARTGQNRPDQTRPGQARPGQARTGQARPEQAVLRAGAAHGGSVFVLQRKSVRTDCRAGRRRMCRQPCAALCDGNRSQGDFVYSYFRTLKIINELVPSPLQEGKFLGKTRPRWSGPWGHAGGAATADILGPHMAGEGPGKRGTFTPVLPAFQTRGSRGAPGTLPGSKLGTAAR